MKHFYSEFANSKLSEMQPMLKKVNKVLDLMRKINLQKKEFLKTSGHL